jgi:hypothetical protein
VASPHPASGQDIPWSTLFLKLGEESSTSTTQALAQLQEIALLHPNVAPAIANVTDELDHARRAATIAQKFTRLRRSCEMQATQEALSVTVKFAAPPPPSSLGLCVSACASVAQAHVLLGFIEWRYTAASAASRYRV